MEKKKKSKQEKVIKLLSKQKIRDVKELDSYKLSVCHPACAGIDLGSAEIYVALPPSIAAEKEVCLVNPKKFRMVPGRKTDILDCQWLQTLHSYGLLRGSFHPVEKIAELRSYIRERDHIIKDRSRYIQRMQKALIKMNLLLHNAIDDITGKTGLSIIRSILAGERDPNKLAAYRDPRIKKSQEEIAESLTGFYKPDQLYLLQSNYDSFCFFDKQLEKIDAAIVSLLNSFPLKKEEAAVCPESN